MTTTADIEALHAHLDAEPGDHTARLILADMLEEAGDVRAEGYRAMARHRMRPCHLRPCPSDPTCDHWMWQLLPRRHVTSDGYTFDADSPAWGEWFRLFCPRLFGAHFGRRGGGRRAAEDAAALAFSQLPADRRRELLAPVDRP